MTAIKQKQLLAPSYNYYHPELDCLHPKIKQPFTISSRSRLSLSTNRNRRHWLSGDLTIFVLCLNTIFLVMMTAMIFVTIGVQSLKIAPKTKDLISHQQQLLAGIVGNSGVGGGGSGTGGGSNTNNKMNSPLAAAWQNANLNKQQQQQQQQLAGKQLLSSLGSSNNKQQAKQEEDEDLPNPNINNAGHNITKILTAFFEHGYDKRVRPNYSGPPAMVNVSFHIIGISSVNEVQMDFTTDFYFRQKWYDPRLMFEPIGEIKELCVGAEFAEKIWLPDTFFANEKTATFHKATTDNTFIRIAHNGRVYRSIRLTVTCSCPMDLQYFPMDRQRCKIEIESYGYNTRDIDYRWEKGNESVSLDTKIELPQFKILGHRMGHELQNLSSGDYIRLYCEIHFVRSMGYYLIQIYIPASLIVIISWVSFWLHRNATPARVALGVTTVLTMTTLMSSTNAALPKISYVKSIDVFLGTCFVMVFASLLEYASVGYVGKRISMKSKRQQDLQRLHQHHQKVCVAAAATAAAAQATQNLTTTNSVNHQQTPKLGFLGRVSNNINSNAAYIFNSQSKQSGGPLVNTANNGGVIGNQQPPNYPATPQQVQQQSTYYRNQQQQQQQQQQPQHQHQHQQPTQTQTLQRRFTTTSAHHNGSQYATSSQPVSVRRLMPDSEPIYGQRSSIKIMIDQRQTQAPIYKQSLTQQSRPIDSDSSLPAGHDSLSNTSQQQQPTAGNNINGKPNIPNNQQSSTAAAIAAAAAAVTNPASAPTAEFEVTTGAKDMIKICGCTPSSIDKYSRVLFPICFVCFNLMYWIIYGHISGQADDDKGPPLIEFIKS